MDTYLVSEKGVFPGDFVATTNSVGIVISSDIVDGLGNFVAWRAVLLSSKGIRLHVVLLHNKTQDITWRILDRPKSSQVIIRKTA
jgi:hypothetical protein